MGSLYIYKTSSTIASTLATNEADRITCGSHQGTRGEVIKKVIDLVNFSAQKIVRRLSKITL